MTNDKLTLGQLITLTSGVFHPVFTEYGEYSHTDKTIGIHKDDIFTGPIRLINGSKNVRSEKFETGRPPDPKLWFKPLNSK